MRVIYEGSKFLKFRDELEKINIPEVEIEFSEDKVYSNLPGNYIYISNFHASPARSNFGTKAMKKIVKLADKHKIILFLFPYGTSSYFYSKFDFIEADKKYEGHFEPLKLFRFYNGYEDNFNIFLLSNKEKLQLIKNDEKNLYAIDFFCSGGGMTFGLKKAGINVLAGIDIDNKCKKTYELNNPGSLFLNKDIFKYHESELIKDVKLPNSDSLLFIGCSPCQYWSLVNSNKEKSQKGKGLLTEFERFVKRYNPLYVIIENVPNIINNLNESGLTNFINFLEKNEYVVNYDIYKLEEYEVPQTRKRFSLIANRKNNKIIKPLKSNTSLTLYDCIGEHNGFPKINAGTRDKSSFQHSVAGLSSENFEVIKNTPVNYEKTLKQRKIYKGNGFRDSYTRMSWYKAAPTITTKFFSISNGRFIHPEENRGISLREGATIQTFPKDYVFYASSISDIAKMIGNAVPPEFARRIGIELIKNFEEKLNYE